MIMVDNFGVGAYHAEKLANRGIPTWGMNSGRAETLTPYEQKSFFDQGSFCSFELRRLMRDGLITIDREPELDTALINMREVPGDKKRGYDKGWLKEVLGHSPDDLDAITPLAGLYRRGEGSGKRIPGTGMGGRRRF